MSGGIHLQQALCHARIERSKGMWRRTYERLHKDARSAERRADEALALSTERLLAWTDKRKSKGSFWK